MKDINNIHVPLIITKDPNSKLCISPNETIGPAETLNTANNRCLDIYDVTFNSNLTYPTPNKIRANSATKFKPQYNGRRYLMSYIPYISKRIGLQSDNGTSHKIILPDAAASHTAKGRLNTICDNNLDIFFY